MEMVFTETAMHVLAAIINGLTVIISVVMMVAVSIVIVITKHWIRPVTVVVAISAHHRGHWGRPIVAIVRVARVRSVALHGHRVLLGVIVAHGGIGIIAIATSSSSSPVVSSISVHCRGPGSVLILRERPSSELLTCSPLLIDSPPYHSVLPVLLLLLLLLVLRIVVIHSILHWRAVVLRLRRRHRFEWHSRVHASTAAARAAGCGWGRHAH